MTEPAPITWALDKAGVVMRKEWCERRCKRILGIPVRCEWYYVLQWLSGDYWNYDVRAVKREDCSEFEVREGRWLPTL